MLSILILTASIGDPPAYTPDPPRYASAKVSASPPSAIVIPPGHHAHRRTDGTILIHDNSNLGNAAAHAGIPFPWPRIAEAGQMVVTATKTQPAVNQPSYAEFLARVEKLQPGHYLYLSVGQPGENRCDDSRAFGIANGLYSCWFDGTQAKMQRIGVAGQQSVPQIDRFNADVMRYNLKSCPNGKCPRR